MYGMENINKSGEEMIKVICWGAGNQCRHALDILLPEIYKILFWVDTDEKRQRENVGEYEIHSPDFLEKYTDDYDILLITSGYWEEIFEQCIGLQIEPEKIKCFDIRDFKIKDINEMYVNHLYSQDGEETYLKEKFSGKTRGIYVDVGAFHPYRFSNTYWAYQLGWAGINIEPNIDKYKLFCALRPNDININCGVSDNTGVLNYYSFKESALNTFIKENADDIGDIQDVTTVRVDTLKNILLKQKIHKIDFIDIDIEGMEMKVLASIDWEKTYIDCILVEQRNMALADVIKSEEHNYLLQKGYKAINKYGRTVIYERIRS